MQPITLTVEPTKIPYVSTNPNPPSVAMYGVKEPYVSPEVTKEPYGPILGGGDIVTAMYGVDMPRYVEPTSEPCVMYGPAEWYGDN